MKIQFINTKIGKRHARFETLREKVDNQTYKGWYVEVYIYRRKFGMYVYERKENAEVVKTPDIQFKCEKCGIRVKPNPDKSNDNWTVFDNKCPDCGSKVTMIFGEGDKNGDY